MEPSKFFLDSIREGKFYNYVEKGKPFSARGFEHIDKTVEWPSSSDPEKKIREDISELLKVEKTFLDDLKEKGIEPEEVYCDFCLWPLTENAPIEAIRAYLEYEEENAKAASAGLIID